MVGIGSLGQVTEAHIRDVAAINLACGGTLSGRPDQQGPIPTNTKAHAGDVRRPHGNTNVFASQSTPGRPGIGQCRIVRRELLQASTQMMENAGHECDRLDILTEKFGQRCAPLSHFERSTDETIVDIDADTDNNSRGSRIRLAR